VMLIVDPFLGSDQISNVNIVNPDGYSAPT